MTSGGTTSWIDRPLTQSILELPRSRRTVTAEMIRHKPVDIRDRGRHFLDCLHPRVHFVAAIHLHPREVNEIAIRSHPPDVCEISRRTTSEGEHDLSRNPAAIDKRDSDVAVAKQRDHAFGDPPAMPELDGESQVGRNLSHEIDERWKLVRLEVGPELHENRTELVLQLSRALIEHFADSEGITQPLLVRYLLRQLQREDEIVRSAIVPALECCRRWDAVEGRIDFD